MVFLELEPKNSYTEGNKISAPTTLETPRSMTVARRRCPVSSSYIRDRKTCKRCGKLFRCKPSHYDKKSYCGQECMAEDYRTRLRGKKNPNYRDTCHKACARCGREVTRYEKRSRTTFCSRECYTAARAIARAERLMRQQTRRRAKSDAQKGRRKRVGPVSRECIVCGQTFIAIRYRLACPDCAYPIRQCATCGTAFKAHRSQRRLTCSLECAARHSSVRQRGAKSHRWQGGKTAAVTLIRTSSAYAEWRTGVFTRDDYRCQLCGTRGGKLAAHHIKPFSTHPDLGLEVSNGLTLCWPCHCSIKNKEADYETQFTTLVATNTQRVSQTWP